MVTVAAGVDAVVFLFLFLFSKLQQRRKDHEQMMMLCNALSHEISPRSRFRCYIFHKSVTFPFMCDLLCFTSNNVVLR